MFEDSRSTAVSTDRLQSIRQEIRVSTNTLLEYFLAEAEPLAPSVARRKAAELIASTYELEDFTDYVARSDLSYQQLFSLADQFTSLIEAASPALGSLCQVSQDLHGLIAQSESAARSFHPENYQDYGLSQMADAFSAAAELLAKSAAGKMITEEQYALYVSERAYKAQQANLDNIHSFGDALLQNHRSDEALVVLSPAYQRITGHSDQAFDFEAELTVFLYAKALYNNAQYCKAEAVLARVFDSETYDPETTQRPLLKLAYEVYIATGNKPRGVEVLLDITNRKRFDEISAFADQKLEELAKFSEIEMPRPKDFQLPEVDERITYTSQAECDSNCRVRIFGLADAKPVVLVTQDELQTGGSITPNFQTIIAQIAEKYGISERSFRYFEHYQCSDFSLEEVTFVGDVLNIDRDKCHHQTVTSKTLEKLTGYRLSWRKS